MGNPVVVVDKADYFNKMVNLLHDTQKFEKKITSRMMEF